MVQRLRNMLPACQNFKLCLRYPACRGRSLAPLLISCRTPPCPPHAKGIMRIGWISCKGEILKDWRFSQQNPAAQSFSAACYYSYTRAYTTANTSNAASIPTCSGRSRSLEPWDMVGTATGAYEPYRDISAMSAKLDRTATF